MAAEWGEGGNGGHVYLVALGALLQGLGESTGGKRGGSLEEGWGGLGEGFRGSGCKHWISG